MNLYILNRKELDPDGYYHYFPYKYSSSLNVLTDYAKSELPRLQFNETWAVNDFNKAIQQHKEKCLSVWGDYQKNPSFWHNKFPDYKINKPPTLEECRQRSVMSRHEGDCLLIKSVVVQDALTETEEVGEFLPTPTGWVFKTPRTK